MECGLKIGVYSGAVVGLNYMRASVIFDVL